MEGNFLSGVARESGNKSDLWISIDRFWYSLVEIQKGRTMIVLSTLYRNFFSYYHSHTYPCWLPAYCILFCHSQVYSQSAQLFFFPLQFLRNFSETCLPRSNTEAKQCFTSKVWNNFPWFLYFFKNRQQVALLPLYESQIAFPGTGLGVVRPGVKSGSQASCHWCAFISVVITEHQFDLTQDGYSLSKCFTNINSLQLAMI